MPYKNGSPPADGRMPFDHGWLESSTCSDCKSGPAMDFNPERPPGYGERTARLKRRAEEPSEELMEMFGKISH